MKATRFAPWVLCVALGAGASPLSPTSQAPVRSASGQFRVLPLEPAAWSGSSAILAESGLLHLDPTLLTVSAERLRQHLTRELHDSSPWQGSIQFYLHRTASFEAPIQAAAEWQGNGWKYRMSLPEYIAQDRFIRALVEVNLMEIANRTSTGRAAEIPPWLTEGLSAHLLVSRSIEIILPPPKLGIHGMNITPWVVEEVNYQPLALAHAQLRTNAPLSIEQLSWPTPDSFEGRKGEAYRHCAQLLVHHLLQLPEGPALINAFIRNLGLHYNWQVAFLKTYGEQFGSLLELEKWWALQVAHFTGRELGVSFSHRESLQRLQQVVRFQVEVRLSTNDLPMHGAIPLQTIIEDWESNRQKTALEQTLSDLALLRARIAPELLPLLDEYRLTLEYYLRNRNRTGIYLPKGINRQATVTQLLRRTVRTLDRLDAELAGLLPGSGDEPSLVDSPG